MLALWSVPHDNQHLPCALPTYHLIPHSRQAVDGRSLHLTSEEPGPESRHSEHQAALWGPSELVTHWNPLGTVLKIPKQLNQPTRSEAPELVF